MAEFPTVVLAGGEGRRIGGRKPLRMLHGLTLIDRSISLARAWSEDVVVAVRDVSQIGEVGAPSILDREDIPGPLGGLVAALTWAATHGHDRVLTIPCDSPNLPLDLAQRLDDALHPGIGVAVAESGEELHPTCSLWRTAALQRVPGVIAEGRNSLRALAGSIGFVSVAWSDPSRFLNINTLADLTKASTFDRQ